MIKLIDTQKTEDPNEFGEIIREASFKTNKKDPFQFGCYSVFEMVDGFISGECPKDIAVELMGGISDWNDESSWEKDRKERCRFYTKGDLTVAWFWDGDGTLYIKEGDRSAINDDCKKTYGWKWVSKKRGRTRPSVGR